MERSNKALKSRLMRNPKQRAEHVKYMRKYRKAHKKQFQKYEKRRDKRQRSLYAKKRHLEAKIMVLTHYGKDGRLQCCWPGCIETDVDVLTCDHIKDDGAEHRKQVNGLNGGLSLYRLLIREEYPKGFQTLCWNHQWKKQILKLRAEVNAT